MKRENGDLVIYEGWAMYDKYCPQRPCWERTVTRTHDIGTPHRVFVGCWNSIKEVCPKRGQTDLEVQIAGQTLRFEALPPDWYRDRRTIENIAATLSAEGVPPRLIVGGIKDAVRSIRPPVTWKWTGRFLEVKGRGGVVRIPNRPWKREVRK